MRKKRFFKKNSKTWKVVAIVLACVLAVGGSVALFTGITGESVVSRYVDMDEVDVSGSAKVQDGKVILNSRKTDSASAVIFNYDAAEAGIYEVSFKTEATASFYHELANLTVDPAYRSQNRDYNDAEDFTGYSKMKTYVIMEEGKNSLKYTVSGGSSVELSGIRVRKVANMPDVLIDSFTFESKASHSAGASYGYHEEFGGACCVRHDGGTSDVATASFKVEKDGNFNLDMIGAGKGTRIVIKDSNGEVVLDYKNKNLLPVRENTNSTNSDTVGGWSATQYIDLDENIKLEAGNYTVEITSTDSYAIIYALLLTQK